MATILETAWERLLEDIASVLKWLSERFFHEKASVVVPAFNEEKTIRKVVSTVLKCPFVGEVVVVDDGSSDGTAKAVSGLRNMKVISHKKNLGKGRALKTGIQHSSNDIVFFIDADLENLSTRTIEALLRPLVYGKADFVKAGFSLKRGRVTEIAVKPMMRILFPGQEFSQPISGQFGARKKFLESLRFDDRWGADISIFLDALQQGLRVVEVDIGELVHKARSLEEKAEMSKQVMQAMLEKAGLFAQKIKTIVFSESVLFHKTGLRRNVLPILKRLGKRRFRLVVLAFKKKPFFGELKEKGLLEAVWISKQGLESIALLSWFKKKAKKTGICLEETAFLAGQTVEIPLLKVVSLGIALQSEKLLRRHADLVLSSISEILLIEELHENKNRLAGKAR